EPIPGTSRKVPPLALIQEDTFEALAISEEFEHLEGKTKSRKARFVILLQRARPQNVLDEWSRTASRWLVAEVEAKSANETLTTLLDFLRRHPSARPVPDIKPAPTK